MTMKVVYGSIGKQIAMRCSVTDIPREDAADLLMELLQLSGVSDMLMKDDHLEVGKAIWTRINLWASEDL